MIARNALCLNIAGDQITMTIFLAAQSEKSKINFQENLQYPPYKVNL